MAISILWSSTVALPVGTSLAEKPTEPTRGLLLSEATAHSGWALRDHYVPQPDNMVSHKQESRKARDGGCQYLLLPQCVAWKVWFSTKQRPGDEQETDHTANSSWSQERCRCRSQRAAQRRGEGLGCSSVSRAFAPHTQSLWIQSLTQYKLYTHPSGGGTCL